METVTVYKDIYEDLQSNEFKYMTELAKLQGRIIGMSTYVDRSDMDNKFILEQLKALAEEIENV